MFIRRHKVKWGLVMSNHMIQSYHIPSAKLANKTISDATTLLPNSMKGLAREVSEALDTPLDLKARAASPRVTCFAGLESPARQKLH